MANVWDFFFFFFHGEPLFKPVSFTRSGQNPKLFYPQIKEPNDRAHPPHIRGGAHAAGASLLRHFYRQLSVIFTKARKKGGRERDRIPKNLKWIIEV